MAAVWVLGLNGSHERAAGLSCPPGELLNMSNIVQRQQQYVVVVQVERKQTTGEFPLCCFVASNSPATVKLVCLSPSLAAAAAEWQYKLREPIEKSTVCN